MWNKPWRFGEGLTIGAGLLIVGTLLQYTIGAVNWQMLASPLNVILFVIYVLALGVSYAMRKHLYLVQWSLTMPAAVSALAYGVLVTLALGLTGWDSMLSSWPFVLIYVWLMNIVGLVAADRLWRVVRANPLEGSWFRTITSIMNHLGLFLAMVCGTLGYADMQRLHMTVKIGNPEWRATDANAQNADNIKELKLAIELHSFTIDEYPPQYVIVDNETGDVIEDSPWTIREDTLYDYAAPRPESDSYVEWRSMGACSAARITATNSSLITNPSSSNQVSGWVSCGSFMFPYKALKLDDRCSAVMPDREPKRYASEVTVYTAGGTIKDATITVNNPLEVEGWKIYQLSYDERLGRWSDVSVFELVRDPWLPFVYLGIFMMLAGAVLTFLSSGKSNVERVKSKV